jgi:hypothetical protein
MPCPVGRSSATMLLPLARLIESGWYKYRPKDLAVLYSNRGAALSWNGDTDNRSLRRRSPQPRTLHGLVLMKKSKVLPGEALSDVYKAISDG